MIIRNIPIQSTIKRFILRWKNCSLKYKRAATSHCKSKNTTIFLEPKVSIRCCHANVVHVTGIFALNEANSTGIE